MTDVPGSSEYFAGGAITYGNAEKVRQLGVDPAVLERYGAVSKECVELMARGARQSFAVDVAVAVSGIAGPGGGTADKPVGTVWFAVAGPGDDCVSEVVRWPGARDRVRHRAAHWALALVLRRLVEDTRS